ncbi:MAG: lysophospholipid acyltransferase family protein [Bacteroidota bacterium]
MHKILYYALVYPFSHLPLKVLYAFRPMLFLLLCYGIRYRKKVITENMSKSFPKDTPHELNRKVKGFYHHLSRLFLESIKNLSFSDKELRQRVKFTNASIVTSLQEQGKNVLLVGGHYGNWEWLITSLGLHFPERLFGLGMPLSSSFWDHKLTERRERFGLKVIHSKNYRETLINEGDKPFILLMLADQSPGDSHKSYWMNFLQQPTAVAFGTEALANETDAAVVYVAVTQLQKGGYEIRFEILTTAPKSLTFGQLTEAHVRQLETDILATPNLWLWSHKRWKREVPEDLVQLRNEQEQRFNQRYR